MESTNDTNLKGAKWWQKSIYGNESTIYPEEDYQIAALPKSLLYYELGRRLKTDERQLIWQGKEIDCSAITDSQLIHHISLHLEDS